MAFLRRLKDWLYDVPTTVLGIDLSSTALKLISMKVGASSGGIEKMAAVDWPSELQDDGWLIKPNEAGAFLKQCLAQNGVFTRKAVVSVGSRIAFVREIDFPVMEKDELASAMQYGVDEYIPLAPDSYYYDYLPGGKGRNESEMKVVLFAAPKEWIIAVGQMLSAADIKLIAVETEALAIKRLIPDLNDFLLLDMGGHTAQLTVFQGGLPVAQRNIPIGGEAIAYSSADDDQENAALTNLGREVKRTVDYYRVNNEKAAFSALVVTGGGWLPAYRERLASFLQISIYTLQPFDNLLLFRNQWAPDYLRRLETRMAVAVGLGLREAAG